MTDSNSEWTPTVSIGLPVYNGGDYLAEAIDSILAQTFGDFELLIQDNASTDDTESICRAYAEKDTRISYIRNATNVGAAANYNLAFQRSRGRYFKWAAHDDVCEPRFLELCVEVLENDAAVVLASGQTRLINADGSPVRYDERLGCHVTSDGALVGVVDPEHRAEGGRAVIRFWDVLVRTLRTFEIFGLIRSDVLRQTGLHGEYYGSDKVLLAQIALAGRFHLLPDVLLNRRCHTRQSSLLNVAQKSSWIGDKKRQGRFSLRLQKVIPGYIQVVRRARIGSIEKVACYGTIAYRLVAPQSWIKQYRPGRLTES